MGNLLTSAPPSELSHLLVELHKHGLTRKGERRFCGLTDAEKELICYIIEIGWRYDKPAPYVLEMGDDGVIHLSITSKGQNPDEVIPNLLSQGFYVSPRTEKIFKESTFFGVTKGVTYNLAIIRGEKFSKDGDTCLMKHICKEANRRGYKRTSAEVPLLVCAELARRDDGRYLRRELASVGLTSLLVVNEPIKMETPGGDRLFTIQVDFDREPYWVDAFYDYGSARWPASWGFVFLESRVIRV
jgi:hypothetical protein